ncbi:TetR/AcrR family transcriptional regulator [Actinotalea sp. M2MS4P-6]|uniref:TetR/AcrR family transcriptional regulator n=1 Tax=Actinotalea sp. M2MS4P-6 TaxID=2983762 RepID=UPI0021E46805|nr:TetR/AcrR family transcriptional regulator [Actinotalea sp. M2MS4P-6]MCV2392980.1 TetR/AcrR family transcriptional regulator [Actinotalea sp. M2MS4P-6]
MDETLVTNISASASGSASAAPSSASSSSRAERTRERLRAAALDLFVRQGFDATTVEQIAAAAGVSHMTFFRHFPTKESVIVEDPYDPLLAEAVAAQPTSLPAYERVRRGMHAAMAGAPLSVDLETQARVALVARTPALLAKTWQNTIESQRVIIEALVASGSPRADAVAGTGACLGAVMATMLEWGAGDTATSLTAAVLDTLERIAPERLGDASEETRP